MLFPPPRSTVNLLLSSLHLYVKNHLILPLLTFSALIKEAGDLLGASFSGSLSDCVSSSP